MKFPVQLTGHARIRLEERTTLPESALVDLLANDQTTSVGYEPSLGLWHRLFYSRPDAAHFVAIQDVATGDIITILPLHYRANHAWRITPAQKHDALRKALRQIPTETAPMPAEEMPGIAA